MLSFGMVTILCCRMFKENIKSDVVFSGIVSLVRSEKHFPPCLDDYSEMGLKNFNLIFGLSIVVVVLILSFQLLIGMYLWITFISCSQFSHQFEANYLMFLFFFLCLPQCWHW